MNFKIFFRIPKIYSNVLNFPKCGAYVLSKISNQNNLLKCRRYLCYSTLPFAYSISLFGLFNDESPDDKLITIIKQSILCIQREQFDKAEQMLHLALRMAQDLRSEDGITYIYDIMANLALEREQFKKAEVLFVDVMRRLLGDGLTDDNTKFSKD